MTDTMLDITEAEFHVRHPLVPNHINPAAGWSVNGSAGCLFETYGDELAFVRRADPRRVWTLIEMDDGELLILSGFHTVGRVGHLVSRRPVPVGVSVRVHLPASPAPAGPR